MGLDITAYSRLKHIGKHEKDVALNEGEPGGMDDYCYYEEHVQAYAYDTFPQSFRGIPIVGTKDLAGGDTFIEGGCYAVTDATRTHGFGFSYTGYNRWRADLQSRFNPERQPDGPFFELIWFADNEGTIGPAASTDLLQDFRLHFERYHVPDMPYYLDRYKDWMRAFELGADGGLVDFH